MITFAALLLFNWQLLIVEEPVMPTTKQLDEAGHVLWGVEVVDIKGVV